MAANSPKTLQEAVIHYADPDVCQQELAAARWPEGVECPTCGRRDVTYLAKQKRWQCKDKHSRRQFSAKVGTIFEDSPISLSKWFVAMWLISSAKNGISSYELGRSIGVTQKTAWFILHRIRLAMQTRSFRQMTGEVEADETYIGGAARFMHKDKRHRVKAKGSSWMGKVAVMGLLERHGEGSRVRTTVIQRNRVSSLIPVVTANVEPGTSIYTDALTSYKSLPSHYTHKVVDHAEQYVKGHVHTNGLENYWSLLKRTIKGTYVSVEPFHLFRYLDEQAYRFNSRKMTDAARFAEAVARVTGKRLTYASLIGERHAQSA
jgi:hypothetical protein